MSDQKRPDELGKSDGIDDPDAPTRGPTHDRGRPQPPAKDPLGRIRSKRSDPLGRHATPKSGASLLPTAERMLQAARERVARLTHKMGPEQSTEDPATAPFSAPPETTDNLRMSSARVQELGWVGLEPVSKRQATSTLVVHMYYLPKVSYCLRIAGRHLVDIDIAGTYPKLNHDLHISVQLTPDFSAVWHSTVPAPEPGIEVHIGPVQLTLYPDRLRQLREAQPGALKIQIADPGGKVIFSIEETVRVVAFNEWIAVSGRPDLLATFVLPNDPAISEVLARARMRLKAASSSDALNGYQSSQVGSDGKPRAYQIAEAIYETLRDDFALGYINPPPSFERTGQKVVLPRELLQTRMGTCLDLALFYAACLERAGLHPVLFIMQGHAFAGLFGEPITLPEAFAHSWLAVNRHATEGALLPVETTGMTRAMSFDEAVGTARNTLQAGSTVEIAVDLALARMDGVLPLDGGSAEGVVP
ncbi:MAG: hypothetical protein KAY32_09810 [Candidatus Eisenbacteria sp.]|nr:hypothetical protein [Candidatus Eisenbacteria bacterium]